MASGRVMGRGGCLSAEGFFDVCGLAGLRTGEQARGGGADTHMVRWDVGIVSSGRCVGRPDTAGPTLPPPRPQQSMTETESAAVMPDNRPIALTVEVLRRSRAPKRHFDRSIGAD